MTRLFEHSARYDYPALCWGKGAEGAWDEIDRLRALTDQMADALSTALDALEDAVAAGDRPGASSGPSEPASDGGRAPQDGPRPAAPRTLGIPSWVY